MNLAQRQHLKRHIGVCLCVCVCATEWGVVNIMMGFSWVKETWRRENEHRCELMLVLFVLEYLNSKVFTPLNLLISCCKSAAKELLSYLQEKIFIFTFYDRGFFLFI